MAWFLGQSLLIIVAAILLGLLVGWLLWGRLALRQHRLALAGKDAQIERLRAQLAELDRPTAPALDPEPAEHPEPAGHPVEEVEEEERADELERVEGIGRKMAGALRQAGIRSYTQLAAADETALRAALGRAGLKFVKIVTEDPHCGVAFYER